MTQSVTVDRIVVDTTSIETTINGRPIAVHLMAWDDGAMTVQVFAVQDGEWGESLLPATA